MYVRSWKCHGDKDMLIYETEQIESFFIASMEEANALEKKYGEI